MSNVDFSSDAWNDYIYWQSNDKKVLKKINAFIKEISRNPYEGTGHPEPLKGNLSGYYSRQINEKDRLVYRIKNDKIEILSCKGHYDDK